MYYVYFLFLSNKDIYKGSCGNVEKRLNEHELGKVESTKNYRPLKLIGFEGYELKSDAQRREKFLKTTEGRRLLKQQYKDIIQKLDTENNLNNTLS
jgi:putative endonuclease